MQRQYQCSCFLKTDENEKLKFDYYIVSESKVFFNEEKPRFTYGIEIIDYNNKSEAISDISINKEEVIKMIDILAKNVVSPVHLKDIVEDML